MKAIELNARIHGMLSDRLIHEFDKASLLKQIDQRIQHLIEARALETGQLVEGEIVKETENFTE
jgi:hypothetical protein